MFNGAWNALYNARVEAENQRLVIRDAERSFFPQFLAPVLGGLPTKLALGFNYVTRLPRMVGGAVVGTEPVENPPAPEISETFRNTELGNNMLQAREQNIQAADHRRLAMQNYTSFSFSEGTQHANVAEHIESRARAVTLPEESNVDARLARLERAGRDSGNGALGELSPSGIGSRLLERALA